METQREDTRNKIVKTLQSTGTATELCEFLADVLDFEREMTETSNKFMISIKDLIKISECFLLSSKFQKMLKTYLTWRNVLANLDYRRSTLSFKQVSFDPQRIHKLKAKSSMFSHGLFVREGDEVEVLTWGPNQVKVRTSKGKEGFLPTLNCLLPSGDINIDNCIEKLSVQLVTSWSLCVSSLSNLLSLLLPFILNLFLSFLNKTIECMNNNNDQTNFKGKNNIVKILKSFHKSCSNILTIINNNNNSCNNNNNNNNNNNYNNHKYLKQLEKIIKNFENNLIKEAYEESTEIRVQVVNIDKLLLLFFALEDELKAFQMNLRKGKMKEVRVQKLDLQALKYCKDKNIRYYEVKLTAKETNIKEEKTYLNPVSTTSTTTTTTNNQDNKNQQKQSKGLSKRTIIKYIIDPRNNNEISMNEAIKLGVIEVSSGLYVDMTTGKKQTIACAMEKGLIKVARVDVAEENISDKKLESKIDENNNDIEAVDLNLVSNKNYANQFQNENNSNINENMNNYNIKKNNSLIEKMLKSKMEIEGRNLLKKEASHPVGYIRLTRVLFRDEFILDKVTDLERERLVSVEEARENKILVGGLFRNTLTGEVVAMDTAVENGWVKVLKWKRTGGKNKFEMKRKEDLTIGSCVDSGNNNNNKTNNNETADQPTYHQTLFMVYRVYDCDKEEYVRFIEAVKRKLINVDTGSYVNNITKDIIFPSEAIKFGYFIAQEIEEEEEEDEDEQYSMIARNNYYNNYTNYNNYSCNFNNNFKNMFYGHYVNSMLHHNYATNISLMNV